MTTPTPPTAHEHLSRDLAELIAADRQPRCMDGTGRWLSDHAEIRARAVELCGSCSLIEPCRAAGESETHGVWGAVDRTRTPGTARRRDKAGAA